MCRGSWVGGVALLNVGGAKLDGVALLCVCMGWGGGWANVAILCMWEGEASPTVRGGCWARVALLCLCVWGGGVSLVWLGNPYCVSVCGRSGVGRG